MNPPKSFAGAGGSFLGKGLDKVMKAGKGNSGIFPQAAKSPSSAMGDFKKPVASKEFPARDHTKKVFKNPVREKALKARVSRIKKPTLKMSKPNLVDDDNPTNPQANVFGGQGIQ